MEQEDASLSKQVIAISYVYIDIFCCRKYFDPSYDMIVMNDACTSIDLLFDWFGFVCFADKNKNCQLSYSWFQTSQTGGQQYCDTSPFGIPCLYYKGVLALVVDYDHKRCATILSVYLTNLESSSMIVMCL